jgi:hypothetical protein
MWDPRDGDGSCSYAYSWCYDQYERRRLSPARGDHRRRPAPALVGRGQGADRGREPRSADDGFGGGAALRAAREPAVHLAPQQLQRSASAATEVTGPGFVPILLAEDSTAAPITAAGRMEIALGSVVVRVGADVDGPALRRVLEVVRGLP